MNQAQAVLRWKVVAMPAGRSISHQEEMAVRAAIKDASFGATDLTVRRERLSGVSLEVGVNITFRGTGVVANAITLVVQEIGVWYYSAYQAGILTISGHDVDWFSYQHR